MKSKMRKRRDRMGLSLAEVASESGLPHAFLWQVENNDNHLTLRQAEKIAKVLRQDVHTLFKRVVNTVYKTRESR